MKEPHSGGMDHDAKPGTENWPKISIVTPSFNQGRFIEKTIDSVLRQEYPNLEYIIIDGGSNDNTLSIIEKYRESLAYWCSEEDRGQSHAINKGFAMASGEIFNWLNSDDYYAENTLFDVARHFRDHAANVVCGQSKVFDGHGVQFVADGTAVFPGDIQNTLNHLHIEQPATFFRTERLKKIGPLNEQLHYVMDKDWWLRYLFSFGLDGVMKVNKPYVYFRHHSDSKSFQGIGNFYNEHAALLTALAKMSGHEALGAIIEEKFPSMPSFEGAFYHPERMDAEVIRKMALYFLLRHGRNIYQKHDFEAAKNLLAYLRENNLSPDDGDCKLWHRQIVAQVRNTNWPLFRIRRKTHWLIEKNRKND